MDLGLQLRSVTEHQLPGNHFGESRKLQQAQVVNSQQMVGFPLNVRNFAQFVSPSSGVRAESQSWKHQSDNPREFNTNVNGVQATRTTGRLTESRTTKLSSASCR
jgi:hypothetical protein